MSKIWFKKFWQPWVTSSRWCKSQSSTDLYWNISTFSVRQKAEFCGKIAVIRGWHFPRSLFKHSVSTWICILGRLSLSLSGTTDPTCKNTKTLSKYLFDWMFHSVVNRLTKWTGINRFFWHILTNLCFLAKSICFFIQSLSDKLSCVWLRLMLPSLAAERSFFLTILKQKHECVSSCFSFRYKPCSLHKLISDSFFCEFERVELKSFYILIKILSYLWHFQVWANTYVQYSYKFTNTIILLTSITIIAELQMTDRSSSSPICAIERSPRVTMMVHFS